MSDPTPTPPPIDWKGLLSFWQSFKTSIHTALTNNKTINALLIVSQFLLVTTYKVSGPLALGMGLGLVNLKGCDWVLPIPPDPNPPNPPIPPVPPVPPVPAPIVGEGFRVLILFDEKKLTTYPESQQSILHSASIRDYLNSKCVLGPDGKTKEFRFYPITTNKSSIDKKWVDAMGRNRTADPWLIVSNGKTGFEGPLPKTIAETMTIFQKYEK